MLKQATGAGLIVAMVFLLGCAAHDYTSEYTWSIKAPASVEKGTELVFKVVAVDPEEKEALGISYTYQVQWPGGTVRPLRHAGLTGEDEKRRASLVPGSATLVVTCRNGEGALVKVAEAAIEVK
jgi:hypothetical protein